MVSSALLLVAHLATAQAATDFPPPPLVPAPVPPPPMNVNPDGPPPTPPPEPGQPSTMAPPVATPAPPSAVPTGPSPYGTPKPAGDEKPPVEYGLMVSEGLFGMLTAAGVSLLPYFLLLQGFVNGAPGGLFGSDETVGWVVTSILFAALPLSTAQTEVSIANGSRWYYSDTWPAALVGLGVEGAVLGISYLARGRVLGAGPGGGIVEQQQRLNPIVLLVGTIAIVPLAQMVIINLLKSPRFGKPGSGGGNALVSYSDGKFHVGIPGLAPVLSADRGAGGLTGGQVSILSGRW
ncbi:MAG: hypothetical protein JNK82_09520 [Myxococcaceae bacterium]|nr:hypothetical protein [Myxococcaceae bacterium]